ncbi:hypothetical protein GIB67_019817, partial [Kingdonia uniflora]
MWRCQNDNVKAIINSTDMKDDLQKEAIDCAIFAFEKHNVEKDVAEHIKEFDKKNELDDLFEKKTRSSNPFTLDWQLKCLNFRLEC